MSPPSGFLLVNNFDVVVNEFTMFGAGFSIHYNPDPAIFGSLEDHKNPSEGLAVRLYDGLKRLFENHTSEIFIANLKSYAVMKNNNLFYFADSHSCGPKRSSCSKWQSLCHRMQHI